MQCVNLTDEELWQAIAHNTTAMSALVYRRLELDAGNTRNDVIDRAQLMQSNLETISKLERKYREYTDELRRRYPAPGVIAVTEVEETRQVRRAGRRDCAAMREGREIMNVLGASSLSEGCARYLSLAGWPRTPSKECGLD